MTEGVAAGVAGAAVTAQAHPRARLGLVSGMEGCVNLWVTDLERESGGCGQRGVHRSHPELVVGYGSHRVGA